MNRCPNLEGIKLRKMRLYAILDESLEFEIDLSLRYCGIEFFFLPLPQCSQALFHFFSANSVQHKLGTEKFEGLERAKQKL